MTQSLMIRLLLVAITLLAFSNLFGADFTSWDDPFTVTSNPHLSPPTIQGLGYHWRRMEAGLYIPVTYTAWWLIAHMAQLDQPDARGFSLDPLYFHLANVLLHATSALIVFAILRRILKRDWPAGLGAMLFALHPIQVEAVGWISGMKDVLCGAFSLAAVWAYLVYATNRSSQRPDFKMSGDEANGPSRRRLFYVLGLVFFVAGILSKPSAMVVPGILLVLDYFWLRRSIVQIARSLWPWFGITILAAGSAKLIQPGIGIAMTPLWARPLIVGDSLSFYLYKLFFPIQLGIDYGRRPQVIMQHAWLYMAWIVPTLVGFMLWRWRRSRPLLLAAGCVFFVAAAPTLGWTRFLFQYYSTTADHYLYVAMLGPALALGWLLTRARTQSVYALCGAVLAVFAILTALQTRTWKSDQALFTQAIATNPNSFAGYNNLGHMYYVVSMQASDPQEKADLLRTAARCFHDSIVANPDYPDSHQNLALVYIVLGDVEKAIDEIKTSLRFRADQPELIRGEFYRGYLNLGQLQMRRHRYAEAVEAYREFLKYEPNNAQATEELMEALEALRPATTQSS